MPDERIVNASIDKKWLRLFYNRVTDQFSLSRQSLHNTHQWAITLSIGFMTAIITFGGNENSYPNEFGLIALLISLPLLFRFFVRSCLECSIQYKWKEIRDSIDKYYYYKKDRKIAKEYLYEVIDLYYFKWKSPKKLKYIVWENLKLAYLWAFIIWILMIGWGFVSLYISKKIIIIAILVGLFMIFEIVKLIVYKGFTHCLPNTPKPYSWE